MTGGAERWTVGEHRQQTFLTIRVCGFGASYSFAVDHAMPADQAPWPGERVLVGTHDVREACEMVAFGLTKATGVAYTLKRGSH